MTPISQTSMERRTPEEERIWQAIKKLTDNQEHQQDQIGKLIELVNKLSGEVSRLEVLIRDEDDEI